MDNKDAIRTTDHDAVKLEEYKGIYSLTSMRVAENGNEYAQWATYQIGKDKHAEKPWPVKVVIGNKDNAVTALCHILHGITGQWYGPIKQEASKPADNPLPDDSVPF